MVGTKVYHKKENARICELVRQKAIAFRKLLEKGRCVKVR